MRPISEYLLSLIDNENQENTYINLKNCLSGKKCCLFSCGKNIRDHKHRFSELYNNNDILIACWKRSVSETDSQCDILGLGGQFFGIKPQMLDDKFCVFFTNNFWDNIYKNVANMHELKKHFNLNIKKREMRFFYENDELKYDVEMYTPDYYHCDILSFIVFLKYLGVSEINLFGCYLSDNVHDITNYTYYDLISDGHFYGNYRPMYYRIKESGWFKEQYQSTLLSKINIPIYNVSENGCYSNGIPRITFDSIFSDDKTFINSKYKYIDIKDQIDKYLDYEYYSKRYNVPIDRVLIDYMEEGFLLNKKLFNEDMKTDYTVNNDSELIKMIILFYDYEPHMLLVENYFMSYIVRFYAVFEKYLNYCGDYNLELLYQKYNIDDNYNFILSSNKLKYLQKYDLPIDILNNKRYYLICEIVEKIVSEHLPDDFDIDNYIKINKFQYMSSLEAKVYYVNNGKAQGQRYK
jgi:hypothetical protein